MFSNCEDGRAFVVVMNLRRERKISENREARNELANSLGATYPPVSAQSFDQAGPRSSRSRVCGAKGGRLLTQPQSL
jgi:hypothetical protein